MLYFLLILMFTIMSSLIAVAFKLSGGKILSTSFTTIIALSSILSAALYISIGNAQGLKHYKLEKKIQKLGGMQVIINKIKQHIIEHPEDKEGQKILKKLTDK